MVYESKRTCKFCQSQHVVRNGKRQGKQFWLCRDCGKTSDGDRNIPGMRYPVQVVAFAITSYCRGWSVDSIRKYAQRRFGVTPSNPTIHTWITKFSLIAKQMTEKYHPDVGDDWITEDTTLTNRGKTLVLSYVMDSRTRFVLSMHLSEWRTDQNTADLINQAFERAKKTPRTFITSNLEALLSLPDLIGKWPTRDIQIRPLVSEFTGHPVTENRLSIEEIFRATEAMRTLDNTTRAIDAWLVYHNFFHPQDEMGQKTPAELGGIEVPYRNWLELLQHKATSHENKLKPVR